MVWKLPPTLSILEALSAVAGDKVHILSSKTAEVDGFGLSERFSVNWVSEKNQILSNDQGSSYGGYLGFPSIAFLMIFGILPYDIYLAKKLEKTPWAELKTKYEDKEVVVATALQHWSDFDKERIKKFTDWILKMLESLELKKIEKSPKPLSDFVGKE